MATSPVPTQVTRNQVGFAPEIAPYAQQLLGYTWGLTDPNKNPYMQYTGERFAQFDPLQQQAFSTVQGMQSPGQMTAATDIAQSVGNRALGYNQYNPLSFTQGSFTDTGVADKYMNPYMQQVLAPQMQAMQRQADIQRNTIGAQTAQAGAFGGSRAGLMNSQLNADLMRQQQQATGQAYGQAFGQAQQQFNQEQAQQQAARQLQEQSRQYGAGLGLQGLQTSLQASQALGALGQSQFAQNMDMAQMQAQMGSQRQQKMQDILSAQYQDYLNYQNFPYKQLAFMSDIVRGVPLTQTGATLYQQPPSAISQAAGLGIAGMGLSKMFGAKGGLPKDFERKPAGLAELAIHNMGR